MKKSNQIETCTLKVHEQKITEFNWLRAGVFTLLFVLISLISPINAQESQISGNVTDVSGEPLPGVNIVIKGTTTGTTSDIDGNFRLNANSNDFLLISFIGYTTQEIAVGNQTTFKILLEEETLGMDEVVVVGYGVKKKSLVTGAISSVKADEIANVPSARVEQALQGRTAGVTVLPTSGSPGAAAKIRIRGTNSNGKSDPLYIVDGMKTGDIDNIDPGDIESVEVLKDAASSAIYGTEGGNGVILITTKKGKTGEGKINYSFQYGLQSSRTQMELMNASDYTTWMQESGAGTVNNKYGADTDWLDEIFETAPMQKHHLSFSGGNDKSSYMLSGSYVNQDGIVGGSNAKFERFTARINANSNLKSWLEVGNSFSFSHIKKKSIGEDDEYRGVLNNALLIDPLTPVKYDKGTIPDEVQSALNSGHVVLQDNDAYFGMPQNVTGEIGNPVALIDTYNGDVVTDKILATFYMNLKPMKGLTFTSRFGIDLAYQVDHSWNSKYYFSTERNNTVNSIDDNIDKWYTWLWENFATYNFEVDNHNMTMMAGYSAEQYQNPTFSLYSAPMAKEDDIYAYHDYTTSRESDIVGGSFTEETMNSIFGRFSYDYKNRYQFEASLRYDQASVFPTDNKGATFPALSVGWVLSEEEFGKIPGIDFFKLRASWGQNGSKANLPGNEDKEFWVVSGIQYPNADRTSTQSYFSGAEIDKLTNSDLKWERTEQIDVGFDIRTLGGKLSFTMDYYNKKTKDLIVVGPFPKSVGNDFPFVNGGDVTNKGFDFEVGYQDYSGKLKYSGNINISTLKNEVTHLNVNAPIAGDNLRGYDLTWFEEGLPIWYFKGYKTDGLNADGTPNVVDVSGDGEITPADQTNIGDPHPDLLLGANFKLEYEGFDLGIFLQGTFGNDIFMGWYRTDRQYSNKPKYMYEDRGKSFPAADNTSDYIYRSDLMVAKGDYLRIKQLQLGYTLPKATLSKIGLSRARVYVSLDDYFTFTGYEGLDPEAGSSDDDRQGVDRGVYPIPGKFLFGLSVDF